MIPQLWSRDPYERAEQYCDCLYMLLKARGACVSKTPGPPGSPQVLLYREVTEGYTPEVCQLCPDTVPVGDQHVYHVAVVRVKWDINVGIETPMWCETAERWRDDPEVPARHVETLLSGLELLRQKVRKLDIHWHMNPQDRAEQYCDAITANLQDRGYYVVSHRLAPATYPIFEIYENERGSMLCRLIPTMHIAPGRLHLGVVRVGWTKGYGLPHRFWTEAPKGRNWENFSTFSYHIEQLIKGFRKIQDTDLQRARRAEEQAKSKYRADEVNAHHGSAGFRCTATDDASTVRLEIGLDVPHDMAGRIMRALKETVNHFALGKEGS